MNETMTDRELNAWLADNLFDLHTTVVRAGGYPLLPGDYPAYSSTGEGMLMVIEAMRERGYYYVLRCMDSLVRGNTRIGCTFEGDGLSGTGWIREADTAPRAVAEAARAALEAEA